MKKKLMVVLLLCAMVVGLLPNIRTQAAGIAILYNKKAPNTILKDTVNTYIYVGGKKINLDYSIGGKTSGVKGTWSSSDTDVITVDKYGICQAVGNGKAYVSFTYTENGEKKVLRVKFKAVTRATAVTLNSAMSGFDGTLEIGSAASFSASLTTNPLALEVNPYIVTTYTTYWGLYADAACTVPAPATIATLTATGNNAVVTALGTGTVYLKAVAKNTPNASAKNRVESRVIPITIAEPVPDTVVKQIDSNKFRVTSGEEIQSIVVQSDKGVVMSLTNPLPVYDVEGSKLSATVTTSQSPLVGNYKVIVNGKETFTILCEEAKASSLELASKNGIHYAILDKLYASGTSYPKAYVYYHLYDQFGNDITLNPNFPVSSYIGTWETFGTVTFPEQGVMALDFAKANLATPVIGSTYNVKLICTSIKGTAQLSDTVTIGEPTVVSTLSFKGIYTYQNLIEGYKKMADASMNSITTEKEIKANVATTPTTTIGAYYLLVLAKDQYGNNLARAGVNSSTVGIMLKGTAGLTLASEESVGSITIDGEKYLAYALTAGKPTVGTSQLLITGGSAYPISLNLMVAAKAEISGFTIVTSYIDVIKEAGSTSTQYKYNVVPTYVDYIVKSTAGTNITDYDMLVELTKATSYQTTTGMMAYITDQSIISSANGAIFRWEKQTDGTAKLVYTLTAPPISLYNGATMATDEIVTLKGTAYESKSALILVVK